MTYALYANNNNGKVQQHQNLLHQLQTQQPYQNQQYLQNQKQQYGQGLQTINLKIILPKAVIEEFEYIPTVQGYRYR